MDFIDDEAGQSQESILVPSSQQETTLTDGRRPVKRRRLNAVQTSSIDSGTETDECDLPSYDTEQEQDENPRSKHEQYMHIPAHVDSQKDQFVTQIEQPWSSPSAIRGPRWRKKSPTPPSEPPSPIQPLRSRSLNVVQPVPIVASKVPVDIVDEFDNEDAEMLESLMPDILLEDAGSSVPSIALANQVVARQQTKSFRQTTLFGLSTTQKSPVRGTQARTHNWPVAARDETPTHHKLHQDAMKTWTYPLNVGTIRDYQFNIVYRALFHNILVALPTGLGKTFIAATVMLNYFNWTQDAQIIFVAPTKPLVTQQVEACFHIAGIPRSQTTLLTGEISPAVRAEEWQEKRVFFMTPQTLINDLKTGMADPKKIVLVVVDEAHKATGNYAYVEVVRFLRRFNTSFRVLALTATPGATVEAVQKVIDGLGIARVEIRTEESMDIRSFVHSRNIELQLFDNSEEIELCLELFSTAIKPVLNKVNSLNAYFSNDPRTITLYGLMKGREQWAKSEAGRNADWGRKGMVNSCFKPLMTLAHNLELLKYHGIGPFYHKMKIFDDEAYGGGKYAKQIAESESFRKLMNMLRTWINKDGFVGHPKLSYLNEVVLNHFMDAGSGIGFAAGRPPSDTRIMIFAHYRDSAEEIARVLNRHEPMIRAHVFVGQSNTKGSDGMDQKTQNDIIKKFKAGTFNTLVATSIGEEGLDIGEVDLIVCYDCSKSPIRMLQRMGRTGRKRAGNIVCLLMRGKEEKDYHSARDNYLKMQEIIENGTRFQYHDDQSPRIVPREIQPIVDKRRVEIPIENTQAGVPEPRKRAAGAKKRPPKKFHMPDNVETGFTFLGGNKSKKQSKNRKLRTPTPEPEVDMQLANLPLLKDVILTSQEEVELDKRYAQVAGSGTEYVQEVRFHAFPEEIRQLRKTTLVRHSTTTKSLIKASKAMRRKNKSWDRPAATDILRSYPRLLEVEEEEWPIGHTRVPTAKHKAASHSSRIMSDSTTRLQDEVNEYDDNDSFIDDDVDDHARVGGPKDTSDDSDTPFYVPKEFSQTQNTDIAEDELPEMGVLFSKGRAAPERIPVPNRNQIPKKRGAKCVVSDDSDE